MKGKSIWSKWIEGGCQTKRQVKYLQYVGPEMTIKELFCLCVRVSRRKDGEEWEWAKFGTCSKCFFFDTHSIKELFSLEGLQALVSLSLPLFFNCLDKSFIGTAILQNCLNTHTNSLIKSYMLVLSPLLWGLQLRLIRKQRLD